MTSPRRALFGPTVCMATWDRCSRQHEHREGEGNQLLDQSNRATSGTPMKSRPPSWKGSQPMAGSRVMIGYLVRCLDLLYGLLLRANISSPIMPQPFRDRTECSAMSHFPSQGCTRPSTCSLRKLDNFAGQTGRAISHRLPC